jgi:D-beta-D-heptose 7-phosphate kinase/D-beta-D-heptose 1-phosphate adenosyltransferase
LVPIADRHTATKTRVVAHRQQVVRVDRETRKPLSSGATAALVRQLDAELPKADAVIVADYGKGVVCQTLLAELRVRCRKLAIWLSLDAKPAPQVDLTDLSLIKPNRREAFALAGIDDTERSSNPLNDAPLQRVAEKLLADLRPALLLITLGENGLLLCQRGQPPFHIPTVAQEVFDVSGAGDTVIASFTLAIAAGASPIEAAVFSNHAAGVVVGKVGTATVSPEELIASFGGKA